MQFVVLCSSRGTTFQAVLDAMRSGDLKATCIGLITEREDRGCLEKAKKAGLPHRIVARVAGEDRAAYDERLDEAIADLGGDSQTIVALMGWMFIVGPVFVALHRHRILNVHPALLPKFGGEGMFGMHVHEAVLAAGETQSGITIHVVDEGVDTGTILVQKSFPIEEGMSADHVRDKAQSLEKEWYPKVLQMIETGELELS